MKKKNEFKHLKKHISKSSKNLSLSIPNITQQQGMLQFYNCDELPKCDCTDLNVDLIIFELILQ